MKPSLIWRSTAQSCAIWPAITIAFIAVMLTSIALSGTQAREPHEMLADPALESRAHAIGQQLRCPVCQGQALEDSQAPLASGLRLFIRRHLAEGASDEAVIELVRQRYGESVLLEPPFQSNTYLLWLAPAILLGIGMVSVGLYLHRSAPEGAPLKSESIESYSSFQIKEQTRSLEHPADRPK